MTIAFNEWRKHMRSSAAAALSQDGHLWHVLTSELIATPCRAYRARAGLLNASHQADGVWMHQVEQSQAYVQAQAALQCSRSERWQLRKP